jgi:hypothetical protein
MVYYVRKISTVSQIVSVKSAQLLLISFFLALAFPGVSSAATYYVNPSAGSDSNPGTSAAPWRTPAWASTNAAGGSTVYLMSGNYGDVIFGTQPARTSWAQAVSFEPASGATPIFTLLKFAQAGNCFLQVEGVTLNMVDKGTSTYDAAIDVFDSSYVKVLNCKVNGIWKSSVEAGMTDYGVRIRYSSKPISDVLIDGCDMMDVQRGIDVSGQIRNNIVLRNNHMGHLASTGIGISPDNTDNGLITIENNHIHNQTSVAEGTANTHGSGIAVRGNNLLIRGNIIHDCGNTRGIRFYQSVFPDNGYQNITVENNLLYDMINDLAVELCDIGDNIVFRNNTVIGFHTSATQASARYDAALTLKPASLKNGSGFSMYNNILVGTLSINPGFTNYTENNNIIWSVEDWTVLTNNYATWRTSLKGAKTIIFASGNNLLRQDVFASSGGFFKGGTAFDTYSYMRNSSGGPHGQDLNESYKLASGSLAIGYGDPAKGPSIDLTGATRGSTNDAGCYQYATVPSTGTIQFDLIRGKIVNANSTLGFSVHASGGNGTLTYSAQNLPSGAAFSGSSFKWTPTASQVGSYTVTFYASDGTSTAFENVVITVVAPASTDLIIDNGETGTSSTGLWQRSGATNPYGADSVWAQDGATYTWQMAGQPSGTYEVFMYWTPYPNRTSGAAVDITSSQGTQQVFVNQQLAGGTWVSLGKFEFDGSGSVTITASNSGSSLVTTCADAVCFRLVDSHPVEPPVIDVPDLIIDNGETGTSSTGLWQLSGAANPYGTDSVWSQNGATYTWQMTGQLSGTYEVFMYWTPYSNRTTSAAVDVISSQGTQQLFVNQQLAGGTWVSLGKFEFDGSGSVTITASDGGSSLVTTCADAVCFRLIDAHSVEPPVSELPEVIIDNGSVNTSSTGLWQISGAPNPYGTDSLWSYGGTTYTWSFTPTVSGTYRVSMWWTSLATRSSSVPIEIQYSSGSVSVSVNQQQNGAMWNVLGEYVFTAGTTYNVILSAPSPDSPPSTCADAVKFEKL